MNRLIRSLPSSLALAAITGLGLLAAGCSSSGSDTAGINTGGDFVVLATQPETNGQLFLNDPIRIDFSNPVDLQSVNLTTFAFQVFDQLGNGLQENVAGTFRIGTSPGDDAAGRRLEFVPRFPTNNTFDNGGFKPGRRYIVQLVGGNRVNGTVLRDTGGKALLQPISFTFRTAEGVSPSQLFRNTLPGGPRRTALTVTPRAEDGSVVLNRFGAPPVEVRLTFDQPISPASTNIPVAFDPNPLTRSTTNRGNIFLEYDDPEFGPNQWIPTEVELEANLLASSTVLLRPVGVLPNNATIRVVVESSVADISGESNVSNAAYDRFFGTFTTQAAYQQQFDALIADFESASQIDFTAAFGEPVGEVGPGFVRAGFEFEGSETQVEFEPPSNTVLDTDFTTVIPTTGTPFNVSGGVFNFRRFRVPTGVTVAGRGTNPLVLLVSGTVQIDGNLLVEGGNGQRGTQIGTANFPKQGGFGACGGGTGGDGSPSATERDNFGETGNGPLETPLRGGTGGTLACLAGCGRGSGGGGGALATQGDPAFPARTVAAGSIPNPNQNPLPIFPQVNGTGGRGCNGDGGSNARQLDGGASGAAVFTDSRSDNNFWGAGLDIRRSLRIPGELTVPLGGGGGGGGGDLSYNNSCTTEDPNFSNDSTGGAGGGGGGVLIIKALSDIVISETGRISADGGDGGAGEVNGSSSAGGGGGGGAGGMVVLMSATGIKISTRGGNFGSNDYQFAVSADGGVCTTNLFGSPIVQSKYPANGVAIQGSAPQFQYQRNYDDAPLGGFGGMGVVQLMAPPGAPAGEPTSNEDSSNTILDDKIDMLEFGLPLTGPAKINALGWRGFPNEVGQLVDDFNNPTPTVAGDIRPQPVLLPTPFAEQSRVRTKWLDTGRSNRRPLTAVDNLPRGVLDPTSAGLNGPRYEFAGTNPADGYANFELVGDIARVVYPTIGAPIDIVGLDDADTYRGQPAYAVEAAPGAFGSVADFYSQYEAELLDQSGIVVGSFRILAHSDSRLRLATDGGPLPSEATQVQLRAKFFEFITNGVEGLGATYPGSQPNSRVPISNVRIGFAFHQNPADETSAIRYPTAANEYIYDLEDPQVIEDIRQLGATFVQLDILFDQRYRSVPTDNPPFLTPDTPRPALQFLRLPFRF